MNFSDIIFVAQWWLVLFIIGLIFLPLTIRIFSNFFDKGYIFAKILSIVLISYIVFLLGILKILPFTEITILIVILIFLILNVLISKYSRKITSEESLRNTSEVARQRPRLLRGGYWKIFLFEEGIFLATLFFWSYIRAHEPSIHGLEKYMDFGFLNSILRSEYFPPVDMWFPPLSINYYYFGHLVTAVLTKLSSIPSYTTFNLMLATIFAFTFTAAFSIGANLIEKSKVKSQKSKVLLAGLLTGFLVSLAGNLHTIYAFFKPYVNENPVPFWQLAFSLNTFPNSYWYPNATRFIYNTIHEFPIYSAVVSDLHGHYLDVPFVLLIIALLFSIISKSKTLNPKQIHNSNARNSKRFGHFDLSNFNLFRIWDLGFGILLLISFLLAVMYMTNAWDGVIYLLLASLVLLYVQRQRIHYDRTVNTTNNPILQILPINKKMQNFKQFLLQNWVIDLFIVAIGFILFSLPFNLFFKPFASGIGVLCSPEFLTNIERLGPFLFEKDHCLRSPIWQLAILYGFFYFWAISFIILLLKKINSKHEAPASPKLQRGERNPKQYQMTKIQNSKRLEYSNFENYNLFRVSSFEFRISAPDLFVLLLLIFSTFLILLPEFIYVKDIYPGHYRANTMFKLVYQAFIMLSISSGYIIVCSMSNVKCQMSKVKFVYWVIGGIGLLLVSFYPYFAINSYYNLKTYQGLDGIKYLKPLYPTDYEAMLWINKNIKGQPVILEAQGDSYTDYGRISTNTGLPTVLGWAVHEWLWRGTYDIPAPRIPEVQKMYESEDLKETKSLLKKYKVELVFFGDLERQKYPDLNEEKFKRFGKVIYENGETRIYDIIKL